MKKERKSKGWKERRTERERPLEFTWSDLKAGIILFSPSSSILLANHYISSVACLPRFFYNVDHPPYSPSFSPPRHVKRKESIFYHVFPRNHVSAEGNERKSEKKRERDSFFFFFFIPYRGPICICFRNNQRLDRFHIIRYIFIPTYLHVIGAVCVMIKHAFPTFITTPIAASFSSQWNINKLLHRITRSVESVSSLETRRAFN